MRRILQGTKTSIMSVIPSEITEDLGLEPGDKLDFSIDNGIIKATPIHTNRQAERVSAAPQEPVKVGGCDE